MPRGIYKREPTIKKGDKYNKLTAIKFVEIRKRYQYWLFKCNCGNEKIISVSKVKSEHTKSCGCLKGGIVKHGMSKSLIHSVWRSMNARCSNPNQKGYKNWGGRGITVCEEWMKFENFYRDMGDVPKNKSLDRIKNNLGYCKSNCKWSNSEEQANNRRNNVFLTYGGKKQTIAEWARELEIDYKTFWGRIKKQKYEKKYLKNLG